MIRRLLIANRGEIARRIIRTCDDLGIESVAVYSDADASAPHTVEATRSVRIGPGPAPLSYLNVDAVLKAAAEAGVDAVHPGYGFLSENPKFAQRVIHHGLLWIGPEPAVMETMGDKVAARNQASSLGIPVAIGSSRPASSADELRNMEPEYPVMLKALAGGGGIGMRVVRSPANLDDQFASATAQAERFFADGRLLVEQYLDNARHIEVQVCGEPSGEIRVLGDRDCSVQRRHQKVVEEAPAQGLATDVRRRLHAMAKHLAETVGYTGLGTVEFLVSPSAPHGFVFIEMNPRLQVEHPVTELTGSIDLVALQLRVAAGVEVAVGDLSDPRGSAIEARVYAEDPRTGVPRAGTIVKWELPSGRGIRVDSGYEHGSVVPPFYDPLLCKIISHGANRSEAIARLQAALNTTEIEGVPTNLEFLRDIVSSPDFASGKYTTAFIQHPASQ